MRAFDQECVLFFEEVVQTFGVPKSVGQIYGLLYASPVPLSFSDIVERLDISKGSASQGLQLLRSLGAINEVKAKSQSKVAVGQWSTPGAGRREYFEPELSLRKLVGGILRERVEPLAATGAERLTRLCKLAERDERGDNFYLDRAKQLSTWRRRLRIVLPLLGTLLGPKTRM